MAQAGTGAPGAGAAEFGKLAWVILALASMGLPACSQRPAREPAAAAQPVASVAQTEHPGKAVYQRACAVCHDNPEATRSPSLDTLRQMRVETVSFALTEGKMQAQASVLSIDERVAVLDYLVGSTVTSDDWIASMMCAADRRTVDLRAAASVGGFGFDLKNQRRLTRAQAGLATADFSKLELAWAIGFPKATTMRSQPVVVGTTLFLPVADASRLFAIDIAGKPCVKWVYRSEVPLRTSAAYGELSGTGRKVIAFGDSAANIHLIDARTGERIWRQRVGLYLYSLTTGTPVVHKDRVYAPISQYEITLGGNDKFECCKTHGAVVALDAATGKTVWTAHTMEDAKPTRDRGDGQMLWGPSGAPIWSSPTIDEKRGVLYVGTGEATSAPAAKTTDAILAIDLQDGSIRWSFQATENDIFLTGCGMRGGGIGRGANKGLNCEPNAAPRDVDFGASVILAQRSDGSDILLAGQKAGTVWALDPDRAGKLVWRQNFGEGSPLGGIHWGIAYDGAHVFAPINRFSGMREEKGTTQQPGMHALQVDTGAVTWTFAAEPDCSGDRQTRVRSCNSNIGLSAAPAVIDRAVVEGSLDGFLRAFDARTGEILFQFDTAKKFETINGVPANGGAIDNAAIVAANGYLLVASGYGMFGQPPGNVLLAFKRK